VKADLARLDHESKEDPQISRLRDTIARCPDPEGKMAARFELAVYYKSKEMSENALETAMEVIRENKSWQDKKANQLVLAIFKELGAGSPLTQKYRKIFQRLLN
jgi:thioredoxin-like negative regulator of GroEL